MVNLVKFIVISTLFSGIALADDADVLLPMSEAPPADQGMSITLHKIKAKKKEPKPVELISPKSDAEFTPGTATFYFRIRSDMKQNKFTCVLENLQTGKKVSKDASGNQVDFDLKPGKYRWQIAARDSKVKSPWRSLDVAKEEYSSGFSGDNLKKVSDFNVDNTDSRADAPKINRADDPTTHHTTKAEEDRKLAEYKQKKAAADQQARDLEARIKNAEMEARRALQVAKEEQLHLKQIRLEKVKAEQQARERLARLEAERQAKIRADQQARERFAKQKAKQAETVHIAKMRLQEAIKRYKIKLQETEAAKELAEKASKDLALKVAALSQMEAPQPTAVAEEEEAPAPELTLPPPRVPASAPVTQQQQPPPPPAKEAKPNAFLRSSGDDLQWSDDK